LRRRVVSAEQWRQPPAAAMTDVKQQQPQPEPEAGLPGVASEADPLRGEPLVPAEAKKPVSSILQLRAPEPTSGSGKKFKPPPSHMASMDGQYMDAWRWFQELDEDDSGALDMEEVAQLMKKCNIKVPNRDVKATFKAMDQVGNNSVSFEEFASWWNSQKEAERRRMRRNVKELFESVDADDSGRLDRQEFGQVAKKAKNMLGIDPPFDPVSDWEKVTKREDPTTGEEEVTYQAFEAWWKERLGIVDADIPVLPEYMVQKIDEAHYFSKKATETAQRGSGQPRPGRQSDKHDGPRTADELWGSLRPRLLSVVRMQRQWGPLHDIYDSQQDSRFDVAELPRWVRDPDSSFSAFWDLTQVMLLLYVAITVPLRAGFSLEVELWSVAFFVDAVIDLYFISDICLNFTTAFYRKDGMREDRFVPIAINYMKGWFFIDLISTLPVSYVPYFVDSGTDVSTSLAGDDSGGQNFRAMKALRLVRLSKMLRLARIKKILMKYGDNVNLQTYISVGFTMFTILFLVHLLTCFFYMVGIDEQVMNNGVVIPGWVMVQEGWEYDPDSKALVKSDPSAPWGPDANDVSVNTRYITATYLVLNALESGGTTSERGFALIAELMRDFILGMVAGLMTTISMAMNGGEQESQWKLRSLKGWMQKNSLPKSLQIQITEYCHELWNNRSGFNVDELFADVPPTMRTHLKQFLYSSTIGQVPLFRGLSKEVIGALCGACKPMYALAGDVVMEEGQPGRELYMLMSGELEVFRNSPDLVVGQPRTVCLLTPPAHPSTPALASLHCRCVAYVPAKQTGAYRTLRCMHCE
jgi:Ca2+-binding EF-hand superfamily protein